MKYAIINPVDNSVHDVQDVLSASDIHLTIGAPYIVQAAENTLVGDIYDPETATFTTLTTKAKTSTSKTSTSSSS